MSVDIARDILLEGISKIKDWYAGDRSRLLRPIFSRLTLSEPLQQNMYFFPPASLTSGINYPALRTNPLFEFEEINESLWQRELMNLSEEQLSQSDVYQLLHLLEKFGAFLPSSNDEYIAIYDEYKIKAATAECLSKSINKDTPYLLVAGDFSGIQNFLYTISSEGALKTLRARSFFLELLNEHIIAELLRSFGISRTSVIYAGGGCFYILAPSLTGWQESISTLGNNFNIWLYTHFRVKLYLSLYCRPLNQNEVFTGIDDVWKHINTGLSREKTRKFNSQIASYELFDLANAEPLLKTAAEECQICRRDDIYPNSMKESESVDGYLCPWCDMMLKLGGRLPRIRYISAFASSTDEDDIKIEDVFYHFSEDIPSNKDYLLIYRLAEEEDGGWPSRCISLYAASYARKAVDLPPYAQLNKENHHALALATFEELAEASDGLKRIGSLRMDVDNLGRLFSEGLGSSSGLSHISCLSRYLTYFFKLYTNILCRELGEEGPLNKRKIELISAKGRNVTIIYSGGDDLFMVGAWDEVCETGINILSAFRKFTCNNPDVSISGGFTLHQAKFPLYQMARLSKAAEQYAKDNIQACDPKCNGGVAACGQRDESGLCLRKGSLSLFYTPELRMRSAQLRTELYERGEPYFERIQCTLRGFGSDDEIERYFVNKIDVLSSLLEAPQTSEGSSMVRTAPRGFFMSLLHIIELWREKGKLYMPALAWLLRRSKLYYDEDLYCKLLNEIYQFNPTNMATLHLPLTWVELIQRGGNR